LTVLDIVILGVIAACTIYGAKQGFIRELSHVVAFAAGLLLAAKLHATAARLLFYRLSSTTASAAGFVCLLIMVLAAVYIIFSYIKATADKLKLGAADHFAGALFGAVQGAFVCALLILVLVNFSSALPRSYLARSRVASFLLDRGAVISGVAPLSYIEKITSLLKKRTAATGETLRKAKEGRQDSLPTRRSERQHLPADPQPLSSVRPSNRN